VDGQITYRKSSPFRLKSKKSITVGQDGRMNDTIAWWIAARFHKLHEWAFLMCDRFETAPIWKMKRWRPRWHYDLIKGERNG
jgi:hypothetical protein